jgi:hypothetical protein
MSADDNFTKVVVSGAIRLGLKARLVQERRADNGDDRYGSQSASPVPGDRTYDGGEASALGTALETKLVETRDELFIRDSGLVTSFGIFGAPGCGKTVLLMHLLKQVLAHEAKDPTKRYGALILDPKAALCKDVKKIAQEVGRPKDLRIINTVHLNGQGPGGGVNVIDCAIDPYELGAILVLAGRSAGIDASDPFWFQEWTNLFTASLSVLRVAEELKVEAQRRPVTLRKLLDAIFEEQKEKGPDGKPERVIQRLARDLTERLDQLSGDEAQALARRLRVTPEELRTDVGIDLQTLRRFYKPVDGQDNVGVIEAFITKAFGMFRRSRLHCYSDDTPRRPGQPPFYEDIIENGRIVLVSISPSEPVLAKTLCTLIKCLFQRAVLARRELLTGGIIKNTVRPLVMACDEYSEIASEVAGQSMGDGQFLALAREYGCMAILATQSVNVLEASSLKETWRSVFSNFAAKIYMRLVDNETAEEASKLAGESDWEMLSRGLSNSRDGSSLSQQRDLRERKNLPTAVLTHVLRRGQAVVIGSLDGGETVPGTYYMNVPRPADQAGQFPGHERR